MIYLLIWIYSAILNIVIWKKNLKKINCIFVSVVLYDSNI